MSNGEGEPVWLAPHQRDSQPEGEREIYIYTMYMCRVGQKVDSNKLQCNVKNEITLICAKFGADLIKTSNVTSRNHFLADRTNCRACGTMLCLSVVCQSSVCL